MNISKHCDLSIYTCRHLFTFWIVNASPFSYGFLFYFVCAEELVTGLSRVSWEKVDVSFHNSRSRFAAHSVIQVARVFVFVSFYTPTDAC